MAHVMVYICMAKVEQTILQTLILIKTSIRNIVQFWFLQAKLLLHKLGQTFPINKRDECLRNILRKI